MNAVEAVPGRAGVLGVLLAGGQARRMGGGDKCLRQLAGRPILSHVIERIEPQVDALLLNANGDPSRFAAFDLPVLPDVVGDFAGPLAGVLTGMEWAAANRSDCPWIITIATDTPFLPTDLVATMMEAVRKQDAQLACAVSNSRNHPVFGLWPVALAGALRAAMVVEDMRKVDRFTGRYRLAEVDFSAEPFDPFFNTNRPEDLEEAERLIGNDSSGSTQT